jgi:hypothetical protein
MELDDAGGQDIYKIDLREAMLLVVEAWTKVKPLTIVNCWNHTRIQPDIGIICSSANLTVAPTTVAPITATVTKPMQNAAAWILIREFATSDEIRLPQVEEQLQNLLGASYLATDVKN